MEKVAICEQLISSPWGVKNKGAVRAMARQQKSVVMSRESGFVFPIADGGGAPVTQRNASNEVVSISMRMAQKRHMVWAPAIVSAVGVSRAGAGGQSFVAQPDGAEASSQSKTSRSKSSQLRMHCSISVFRLTGSVQLLAVSYSCSSDGM